MCILDGFGFNTEDKWNGIHMAETPVYDSLRKNEERFRCIRPYPIAAALWRFVDCSRNAALRQHRQPSWSQTQASRGLWLDGCSTQSRAATHATPGEM